MKIFAFSTMHHEGFFIFDTKTRVKNRANWTVEGGQKMAEVKVGGPERPALTI